MLHLWASSIELAPTLRGLSTTGRDFQSVNKIRNRTSSRHHPVDSSWKGVKRATHSESLHHRCCLALKTAPRLGRNLGFDGDGFDILRGDDKRKVRERLWEVADLTAKFVVILLGEKTQVIT